MAVNSFANIVNSYGLKSNGTQAIDIVNGIPVRIFNSNGTASVFVYAGGKDKAEMLIGSITAAAQSMGLAKPRVQGDSITFGFKKPLMAVEDYSNIRQIISNNAAALNIDQCPYCFMGGCDTVGIYKNATATKMHRACYMKNRTTEMDKVENSDGNYVTGILGAIGAAILIVALAEFLVLGAERIFYILYIAFPLFIAGGFRFGKGPYGAKGTICHVTVSLLAMFVYFYIQGCYYAAEWYDISILDAVPYFGDIMSIILDPEFIRYSALEIVLFVVGLLVAIFANPTSKQNGRKAVQQNDVFLTPISTGDYGTFGTATTTEQYQNAYDNTTYGSGQAADIYGNPVSGSGQTTDAYGNPVNNTAQNDYYDVYGNNSQNNNNGFGN